MADQNLLIRMILDANNYDKGMAKAQKSVQAFISDNMSLGGVLSSAGKALGAMAAAAGVAGGALEAARKTIAATQKLTDEFEQKLTQAKSAVDSLFYSLASGNFDNFLEGLRETVKYAKEAATALDDLGTFNIFAGAQGAEVKQRREDLKAQIKTGYRYDVDGNGNVNRVKLTDAEIAAAKEELRAVQAEYIQLIKTQGEKERDTYNKIARQLLKENKFNGDAIEMDAAVDMYMRNYGSYQAAAARKAELEKAGESRGTVEALGGIIQYAKYGFDIENLSEAQQKEYRQLEALLELNDDKLKALMQHRINAAMAAAQLSAELRADEKVLGGGSTSGGKAESRGKLNDKYKTGPFADSSRLAGTSEEEMTALAADVEDLDLEELPEKFDDASAAYTRFVNELKKNSEEAGEYLGGLSGAFSALGDVVGGTSGDNIKAIGKFLDAAQGVIPAIQAIVAAQKVKELSDTQGATAAMTNAAAQGANAVAGIPVAGPALAIAAITSILGMVGAIKSIKFAEGGVVPGNNYTDGIQAKVSAGEVVLNSHDAKNLYDQIHSGNLGGGGGAGYVSGENIYIGLNNYLSRTGKGRLVVR